MPLDSATTAAPAQTRAFKLNWRRSQIARIARQIASADFGAGALAELRRKDPCVVSATPSFHRLTASMDASEEAWRGDAARRWATVIQAMAIGTSPGQAGSETVSGTALAEAGFAESRLARLLASHGDAFRDQVVLLARYMNSKQARFHWGDLGELVLVEGLKEKRAEALRFRIARDYYRALAAKQQVAS
jgi:hypothetical protein